MRLDEHPTIGDSRTGLNHAKLSAGNDFQQSLSFNLQRTGRRLNRAIQPKNAAIPSKKPTAENDDGLCWKDSREFRGPVELFMASVAEWGGDVVRLVMAA